MKTITCPNPACAKQHGLFWSVSAKDKRELMYRCDRVFKQIVDPDEPTKFQERYYTSSLPAPDGIIPDAGLPEEYTAAYKKKINGQNQFQLILMK